MLPRKNPLPLWEVWDDYFVTGEMSADSQLLAIGAPCTSMQAVTADLQLFGV